MIRMRVAYPLASRQRRLAGHVLTGGIAGVIVEAQVTQVANGELQHFDQLAEACRGFGRRTNAVEMVFDPVTEVARRSRITEEKYRRALHVLLDDRGAHAAAFGDQPHAAVVAGHQRAFGGRHRHVEIALRMLAVDPQRTGDADRHLRHSGEQLDVAAQRRWRQRIVADMVGTAAGPLLQQKVATRLRCGLGVIVIAVARHRHARRRLLAHGLLQSKSSGAHASNTAAASRWRARHHVDSAQPSAPPDPHAS